LGTFNFTGYNFLNSSALLPVILGLLNYYILQQPASPQEKGEAVFVSE
jgi:hypothetical protein